MTISARVEKDSISPTGNRLTTFVLRVPKFLLAQINTHRAFSRSAASSRAIPVERLIQDVIDDPVIPLWTKNKRGMQGAEFSDPAALAKAEGAWREALDNAITTARQLANLGAHKQNVNRILEPFAHVPVVITTSEPGLKNFFALRTDSHAQPEMQVLADLMLQAYRASTPRDKRNEGDPFDVWHFPFIREGEFRDWVTARAVSVARCARVSYNRHDGDPSPVEEDRALFDRLKTDGHMGPFEQQARPLSSWHHPKFQGNLVGWVQYRKKIAGECRDFDV